MSDYHLQIHLESKLENWHKVPRNFLSHIKKSTLIYPKFSEKNVSQQTLLKFIGGKEVIEC